MAGIAVLPGDRFTIVFAAAPAGGVALVSFGEREEILVQARPGAARFTTEPDRLLIEARSAADTFAIEIPRTAARVEIRAGGARLLVAERGRVVPAIAADSLGRYRRSPSPPAGDSGDGRAARRHNFGGRRLHWWECPQESHAGTRTPTRRRPAMRTPPTTPRLAAIAVAALALGCSTQDATQPSRPVPADRPPRSTPSAWGSRTSIPTISWAPWTTRSFRSRWGAG